MIELIEHNREALREACVCYQVRRLELFGSAARGAFDPQHSDLDFLVEFGPLRPGQYADAYFGLLEALEALFGRSVDLVMVRAIRNPSFLAAVNREREVLYAA